MLLTANEQTCPPIRGRKLFLSRQMRLIMKLMTLFIFAACLQVHANSYAQTVTYSAKNTSIEKVFKEIKKQTGYAFIYNNKFIAEAKPVTIEANNTSLKEVLDATFRDQPFTYEVMEKMIVVKEKIVAPKNAEPAINAGPIDISGKITDKEGNPLNGASIKVKGTNKGTTTNEDGMFNLKSVDGNATLEISFVGYDALTVSVNYKTAVVASLTAATASLQDVVVNKGYYTTTQRLNTGDVSTVKAADIEKQVVSNPLGALEGHVAGLIINQTTGVPGGGFTVQLRGLNSIINGNSPFFVIDGVPYNSTLPGNLINSQLLGGNPLNFINPYDIESIDILKDADATAIYGSRAANGAILITTKKGKAGTMKVDLNVSTGFTNPNYPIKLLNTQQYLAMRHEAFKNDGASPGTGDHDINGDWDSTRYTDWRKVLMNKGYYTNSEATFSGGNTNTQYLIGGGYYRQTTGFPTMIPGDGADQKASLHFNLNTSSTDKRFKLALTASYVADKNTVQSENVSNDVLVLAPDAPAPFNPDGSLNWAPVSPGQLGTWINPFSTYYKKYRGLTSNLVSNATLSYSLLQGLELKTNLGYTNTQTDEILINPTTVFDPARHIASGTSQFNTMNSHSWIIEPQAEYRLQIGRGLFSALAGGSFHQSNNTVTTTIASGFTNDALLENIQAASTRTINTNTALLYKYQAVFGRLNYNWDDKYLINVTARRDGSSRFGPGKQFADFAAAGAAWIFSKENFIQKNVSFLSFGKIRASYGSTGNDGIGDYKFLDLYNPTAFPYQGSQGLGLTGLFNPDFAWEITKKFEVAIELGFLKNRITFQANFYRNRSGNELVQTPVSVVTGSASLLSNLPALLQNTGKEFVINSINIKSKNFIWSSSFNLTIARNKLLSFPNLASSSYASKLVIGQSINVQRLFHYTGVNDTTGLYQFASSKGGNTSNPDGRVDNTAMVDINPKFYGGFGNSFSYKGFTLDIFFQFTEQKSRNFLSAYGIMPGNMANQPTEVLDRWRTQGDQKTIQQYSQAFANAYNAYSDMQGSDYGYGDASFIRLRNMSVSWQLPSNWKKKMHMDNCRVYVQGQNLLTISKYDGIDPETQGFGAPTVRAWTAGFQITF